MRRHAEILRVTPSHYESRGRVVGVTCGAQRVMHVGLMTLMSTLDMMNARMVTTMAKTTGPASGCASNRFCRCSTVLMASVHASAATSENPLTIIVANSCVTLLG